MVKLTQVSGIGGGRIPYDVNTALLPAALRCIASLSRAGVYEGHSDWGTLADTYAKVWEDDTLQFFQVGGLFLMSDLLRNAERTNNQTGYGSRSRSETKAQRVLQLRSVSGPRPGWSDRFRRTVSCAFAERLQ